MGHQHGFSPMIFLSADSNALNRHRFAFADLALPHEAQAGIREARKNLFFSGNKFCYAAFYGSSRRHPRMRL
jgi:hypothetical protein